MNDTQFQIDHLIELAVLQRAELKQLVDSMPQLRDHLSEEIERNLEEAEPAIRSELEQLVIARANDEHAKISVALTAKIDELAKALEITTAAKYSVLMTERLENANLLAKAEARIEDAASMLTHAVKEIVTDELSRFPRAGEIDQLRKEFAEPRGLNPRGRWMPDETYQRLDLVTINGDSFVSNIDGNRERPSRTAGDWTLSAARGNGGGGGGVTSMTDLVPVPSNGQLLIGNGSAFVNSTLTAGTGISISNGAGSITISATDGNITLDDGTAAAPSLNFTNEPTTGLFRASANVMGFAVAGVSRATMTTTGVTVTGTITPSGSVHAAAGSVGNPSLAFDADQDTGLFRIGANNLGVAAGGAKVLDVATTGLGVTGTLSVSGVATLGAGAILNTPASGTLTNATGLPISTGVSGLGANVAAFLATPSSANLAAALTDETGTGANVFATSPTLTTPISATLTSPAATDLTLAGGSSGASLVLGQGTAASATVTTTGASQFAVGTSLYRGNKAQIFVGNNTPATSGTTQNGGLRLASLATGNGGYVLDVGVSDSSGYAWLQVSNSGSLAPAFGKPIVLCPVDSNVLIGTTSETGLTGAGGLKINSSTAGSASAGALVVTGGLATGAASYFGGAVSVVTTNVANPFIINSTSANLATLYQLAGVSKLILGVSAALNGINNGSVLGDPCFRTIGNILFSTDDGTTNALKLTASTGAATFAGAVTTGDTATIGSSFAKVIINRWSDATNYGAITLNGNTTVAGGLGIGGGASGDSTLYLNAPTGGKIELRINGTVAQTITSAGAATFAGAVSITGNVGFYGQAATAKPTGVAVTAAAIHAALVTLNLIAA